MRSSSPSALARERERMTLFVLQKKSEELSSGIPLDEVLEDLLEEDDWDLLEDPSLT